MTTIQEEVWKTLKTESRHDDTVEARIVNRLTQLLTNVFGIDISHEVKPFKYNDRLSSQTIAIEYLFKYGEVYLNIHEDKIFIDFRFRKQDTISKIPYHLKKCRVSVDNDMVFQQAILGFNLKFNGVASDNYPPHFYSYLNFKHIINNSFEHIRTIAYTNHILMDYDNKHKVPVADRSKNFDQI